LCSIISGFSLAGFAIFDTIAEINNKSYYQPDTQSEPVVNAQARNRGLLRLLVRGVEKVKAVLLWHALAHNMARLWSLAPA